MGLFDNVRKEVLEEFDSFISDGISTQELFTGNDLSFVINGNYSQTPVTGNCRENDLFDRLERKRWGYYPVCPFCNSEKTYFLLDQKTHRCGNYECKNNFNVFTNTILSNTKLSINIWFDIATAYRNNSKVSSRELAKQLKITQKTSWNVLSKIKTSPYISEPDISVMQVLLTPLSYSRNRPKPNKLTLEKQKANNIKYVQIVYQDNHATQLISSLYLILETIYKWDASKLSLDIDIPKHSLYRYFNGKRKISPKNLTKIEGFVNKVSTQKMSDFFDQKQTAFYEKNTQKN